MESLSAESISRQITQDFLGTVGSLPSKGLTAEKIERVIDDVIPKYYYTPSRWCPITDNDGKPITYYLRETGVFIMHLDNVLGFAEMVKNSGGRAVEIGTEEYLERILFSQLGEIDDTSS